MSATKPAINKEIEFTLLKGPISLFYITIWPISRPNG